MRFDLRPPIGVDPIPAQIGIREGDVPLVLEAFFGAPAVSMEQSGLRFWTRQAQPFNHETSFFFYVEDGSLAAIEVASSAVYYDDTIEVSNNDEVRFQGVELFNADSEAVLAALSSLGYQFEDDDGFRTTMSLPDLGFTLRRGGAACSAYPDEPNEPWNRVGIQSAERWRRERGSASPTSGDSVSVPRRIPNQVLPSRGDGSE